MRTVRRPVFILATAFAALLCASQAAAQWPSAAEDNQIQVDADGATLQAGEYAWLPGAEARNGGPVALLVDLRDQRAYLYRDGRRVAVTTVSTGKPGHDTPTGVFPIIGKEKMHHSSKYENAPMPWMQRLTQWGHALHAGNVRPYPASHGCVRLPAEFARQLYSLTRPGDIVVISADDTPVALQRAGVDDRVGPLVGVPDLPPRREGPLVPDGALAPAIASEAGGANGVTAY